MLIPISNSRPPSSCLGCAGCDGNCSRGMSGGMSGLGLFDSGLDIASWGLTEWLLVGGGLFLAFGGGAAMLTGGGATSGRRKKLQVARAKYELERATV